MYINDTLADVLFFETIITDVLFLETIMSPVILLIIAIHIFIVRLMTKKERQEIRLPQNKNFWIQCKKAALGFKIATIAFLFTPLPFIFPSAIEPTDSGPAALFFMILLGVSIAVFLSSFSAVYCYNFLFYVASDKTASIILCIPLSALILCSAVFPPLIIPCAIFVLIARAILLSKRKRFYKAIADTECKLIQEQSES